MYTDMYAHIWVTQLLIGKVLGRSTRAAAETLEPCRALGRELVGVRQFSLV